MPLPATEKMLTQVRKFVPRPTLSVSAEEAERTPGVPDAWVSVLRQQEQGVNGWTELSSEAMGPLPLADIGGNFVPQRYRLALRRNRRQCLGPHCAEHCFPELSAALAPWRAPPDPPVPCRRILERAMPAAREKSVWISLVLILESFASGRRF